MTAPAVVWVLGSDSDLPHIQDGLAALRELDISFEVRLLSAHRTPDAVDELARSARERGVRVLIGVAGGAAHLPGVLAARTTLPVIGVPIPTDLAGGLDSLLSIVQMPAGIPVATVAAGKSGGRNAALLAASIMSVADARVAAALDAGRRAMADKVLARDREKGVRVQGG
ncbi:MAG TPA: 5-(carboxyamino)imidazole ribonucleotide mutase [Planctomycetota bacterium]|nr:5-(carboxyamino)imidazole ribonucleotide mutase [Planctomycetota bacterium]